MKAFSLNYVNASECYYGQIIIQKNCLFIPTINVGLLEAHPLNRCTRQVFINKAYFIFEDLKRVGINLTLKKQALFESETAFFIDGYDIEAGVCNGIAIHSSNSKMILLDNSQLSDRRWIPVHTPDFPVNMDQKDVRDFIYNRLFEALFKNTFSFNGFANVHDLKKTQTG